MPRPLVFRCIQFAPRAKIRKSKGIFHLAMIFNILKVLRIFFHSLNYSAHSCYFLRLNNFMSFKSNFQSLESFRTLAVFQINTSYFFKHIFLFHSLSQKCYETPVTKFKIYFLYYWKNNLVDHYFFSEAIF